jgi:hypothetical protein
MRIGMLPAICFVFVITTNGQYFHQSDIFHNLKPEVQDGKNFYFSASTYSFVNLLNTVPNILDNFQVITRYRADSSGSDLLNNLEIGAVVKGFISSGTILPFRMNMPPMSIRVYDPDNNNRVVSPGVQLIRNIPFNKKEWGLQLGLAGYYNFIGMEDYFSESHSFAYDLSAFLYLNRFGLQIYHSAHNLNASYTFRTENVEDIVQTDKKRISLPEEFENLTFFTLSLGDHYLTRPDEKQEVLYSFYLSFRYDVPSDPELRPEFKIKYVDVLTGCNLYYRNFLFNPEVLVYERNSIGMANYNCLGASFLAGYTIKSFSMKLGYTHFTYYQQAIDYNSLRNSEDIQMDRLVLSLGYSL